MGNRNTVQNGVVVWKAYDGDGDDDDVMMMRVTMTTTYYNDGWKPDTGLKLMTMMTTITVLSVTIDVDIQPAFNAMYTCKSGDDDDDNDDQQAIVVITIKKKTTQKASCEEENDDQHVSETILITKMMITPMMTISVTPMILLVPVLLLVTWTIRATQEKTDPMRQRRTTNKTQLNN